jgi:uracil-DNA glycosylase
MFVGHNLDAEGPYRERLERGVPHGDRGQPMSTWRGLYRLLETARVDVHRCFFTNAYVGLMAGDKPTGRFPGALDAEFSKWCERFLRMQISRMKPAVIATIGADARRFLARVALDLASWRYSPNLTVTHAEIDGHAFRGVALAHPSMYPASARNRSFAGEHGVGGDAALLRAAERSSL